MTTTNREFPSDSNHDSAAAARGEARRLTPIGMLTLCDLAVTLSGPEGVRVALYGAVPGEQASEQGASCPEGCDDVCVELNGPTVAELLDIELEAYADALVATGGDAEGALAVMGLTGPQAVGQESGEALSSDALGVLDVPAELRGFDGDDDGFLRELLEAMIAPLEDEDPRVRVATDKWVCGVGDSAWRAAELDRASARREELLSVREYAQPVDGAGDGTSLLDARASTQYRLARAMDVPASVLGLPDVIEGEPPC